MPKVTLHLWNLNRISALKYIHIKKMPNLFLLSRCNMDAHFCVDWKGRGQKKKEFHKGKLLKLFFYSL